MKSRSCLAPLCLAALATLAGCASHADEHHSHSTRPIAESVGASPAGQDMQLPKGWTEADMQACMAAATPGPMHAFLAEGAGTWAGKTTMWMGPDTDPMTSDCTSTTAVVMDGRYVMCDMKGEMPGMGPFTGHGIQGYDNVSKKFVGTWIDNCSTGVMQGVGELSADKKTLTWEYTMNCPLTKKPTVMREVERITGPDTRTLEMFGKDPKSGAEYQMMRIEFKRTGKAPAMTSSAHAHG
jgi:hypothetical protein